MANVSRRRYLTTSLAAAATPAALAAASSSAGPARTQGPSGLGIKLAMIQTPGEKHKQLIAKQIGVNYAIANVNRALSQVPKKDYYKTLKAIQAEFAETGLTISGVESHPVPAEKIKLGLSGRDEEIDNYLAAIEALSQAGIRILCYNFMAGLGWYRTNVALRGRGGALVTEFKLADAEKQGLTQWGEIPQEKIWSNMEYFLKAVIPAAEKHGIQMALHPDDPPLAKLRGIGRILVNAEAFRRVMRIVPSPVNGITFCQANFVAMGENIEALAKEWCGQKKIFFVHFRDIAGSGTHFRETFHDEGPTDMRRMLEVYSKAGFDGPIRPDHAPTLDGEANDRPGYAIMGKMLAIGYMRGLLEGMKLPFA